MAASILSNQFPLLHQSTVILASLTLVFIITIVLLPRLQQHCRTLIQGFQKWPEPTTNNKHGGGTQTSHKIQSRQSQHEREKRTSLNDKSEELVQYKELYQKLQNLEDNPDIIPRALDTLLSLFSSAILFSHTRDSDFGRGEKNIFSLAGEYNPRSLRSFLKTSQDETFAQWEEYIAQRANGGGRVMFKDKQSAVSWLEAMAPLKLVDGAWLGHISRTSTAPFIFSGTIKILWQILSEEYGDGDLRKHHVHVYRQLLQPLIARSLPSSDSPEFIQGMNTALSIWRAAVGQLLISLFAHRFLPEVIGFNLNFEAITLQTLIAAKELRELDMDPSYFYLHIAIDNADSGHSAMAAHAVEQYLATVESGYGAAAVNQYWKRIQIGFALCQYLCEGISLNDDDLTSGSRIKHNNTIPSKMMPMTEIESRFVEMVQRKCRSAEKLHCGSRASLGDRKLSEWLDPEVLSCRCEQSRFLDLLSNNRRWVQKGDSDNSKLVKELLWGGKMFGSFTNSEVDTVRAWIESLKGEEEGEEQDPNAEPLYWSFSGRSSSSVDDYHSTHQRVIGLPSVFDTWKDGDRDGNTSISALVESIRLGSIWLDTIAIANIDMTKALPLWFAQPSLLQSLISIPARSSTQAGCAVLSLLRAQEGFETEGVGVAGTDEMTRSNCIGILELGLEMTEAAGLVAPKSLVDALEAWPSEAAATMLHLTTIPKRATGILIGISWAFVDLHHALSSDDSESPFPYLSQDSRDILLGICERERGSLAQCVENLEGTILQDIYKGHAWGRVQIRSCFG